MAEDANMLQDSAGRLFADHFPPRVVAAAERGEWPAEGWAAIEDAGFTRALVSEDAGGYGVSSTEALSILRAAGSHAVPLPLAETMAASWLLSNAGLPIPDGPLSIAPVLAADRLHAAPIEYHCRRSHDSRFDLLVWPIQAGPIPEPYRRFPQCQNRGVGRSADRRWLCVWPV